MRIGVFGGTFDPPHVGHLILADEAYLQLDLSHVLWVPTSKPPHKQGEEISNINQRVDLVKSAIKSNSHFSLSMVDIDRPPPHYAVETMDLLKNTYSSDDLIYLMGGDSLENLHKWHRPTEFLERCFALGVMRRPGAEINMDSIEKHIPGIHKKIVFIDTPLIGISASKIRSRIKNREAYRYYLPAGVYQIIESRNLYRESSPASADS